VTAYEQVHLRIPCELLKLVREYAAERGISVTAAVNVLLHEALAAP
jgi:hypothetical protein